MYQNERLALTVKNGPLAGKYHNLSDYLDAEAELQRNCPHKNTRFRELVSGIATSHPHHSTATICNSCKKVLQSDRKPISRKQAKLLLQQLKDTQ